MRRDCEISGVSSLFGHPMAAAALGVLLGAVLTLASERAASFVTPQDPFRGIAIVAVMTGARLVVALLALGVYSVFARDGLAPFGFALGVSFIVGLALEAVKASRLSASHTSA
ncbi:MAG: hypothetical protein JW733_08205 [Coriobacteriia bacterium]|nr:hypothetical protein [Coriobacteriia bacterium]MBN2840110.1 hypothetical protein [Coriobacteriia bacterium]